MTNETAKSETPEAPESLEALAEKIAQYATEADEKTLEARGVKKLKPTE